MKYTTGQQQIQFYKVIPFPYIGYRVLCAICPINKNLFGSLNTGHPVDLDLREPIAVTMEQDGPAMDMDFDSLSGPIVTSRMANLLTRVAPLDIQLFPAELKETRERLFMLNITSMLDCLDRGKSVPIRIPGPGSASIEGQNYVIDPAKVGQHQLFRLAEHKFVVILTEALKQAILDEDMIGPGLTQLTSEGRGLTIMPGISKD